MGPARILPLATLAQLTTASYNAVTTGMHTAFVVAACLPACLAAIAVTALIFVKDPGTGNE